MKESLRNRRNMAEKTCVITNKSLFSVPVKDILYTPADIKGITSCNDRLPIIVEVGGERIPLRHVYTVTQDMIEDDTFPESALGSLVLDLDI